MKKRKQKKFVVHSVWVDPYGFWVIYAAGPDIAGARDAIAAEFSETPESVKNKEPNLCDFLDPDDERLTDPTNDGWCLYRDESMNFVLYFSSMHPELKVIAHEVYHAVRRASKNYNLESDRDEPEAYLFEKIFGTILEKLREKK